MKLPNSERAIVDIAKLRDYSLDPVHKEGRHKARVFAAALGLSRNDAIGCGPNCLPQHEMRIANLVVKLIMVNVTCWM